MSPRHVTASSPPSWTPAPGAPCSGPPARLAAAGTPGYRSASSWLWERRRSGPRVRELRPRSRLTRGAGAVSESELQSRSQTRGTRSAAVSPGAAGAARLATPSGGGALLAPTPSPAASAGGAEGPGRTASWSPACPGCADPVPGRGEGAARLCVKGRTSSTAHCPQLACARGRALRCQAGPRTEFGKERDPRKCHILPQARDFTLGSMDSWRTSWIGGDCARVNVWGDIILVGRRYRVFIRFSEGSLNPQKLKIVAPPLQMSCTQTGQSSHA